MSIKNRFRNWRRKLRWRRVARKHSEPLREFVYLDEISIYSLMASQVGPIVTELTDTEASSLQSEAAITGGGNIGAAKLESRSALQVAESQSRQVLRKSIVQTTFKEFYDLKREAIALRPQDVQNPDISSRGELEQLATEGGNEFLLDARHLHRGGLIEVEVALEAEAIFQAGEAITSILEVIQDDPQVFGITEPAQLAEVRSVSRVLERLRAGLVPIRGTAPDLVIVELQGHEWVAHRSVLENVQDEPVTTMPLHVVGVAEQGLFWKDLRRVLFANSNFRLLGRLGRSGLHQSWTPVKLVDVLDKIVPDFKTMMDKVNSELLPSMTGAAVTPQSDPNRERAAAALERFATDLVEHTGGQ